MFQKRKEKKIRYLNNSEVATLKLIFILFVNLRTLDYVL